MHIHTYVHACMCTYVHTYIIYTYIFFLVFGRFTGSGGLFIQIRTRLGLSAAFECGATSDSNPPFEIQWWRILIDGTPIERVQLKTERVPYVESIQNGRYLYFSAVDNNDIKNSPYTCFLLNPLTSQIEKSNIIYVISSDLPNDEVGIFPLSNETITTPLGDTIVLYIPAAYGTQDINAFDTRCRTEYGNDVPGISTRVTFTVQDSPIVRSISCDVRAGSRVLLTHVFNLRYVGM